MENLEQNQVAQSEPAQIKSPNTMWAVIITAIVVAVLVGEGMYLLQLQRVKSLEKQLTQVNQTLTALVKKSVIDNKEKVATSTTTTEKMVVTTTTNKYTGWKSLEDKTVGYSIKYPATWEAKIEAGTTGPNAVIKPNTKYHYLSLKPIKIPFHGGQKWDFHIGINKKDSEVLSGLRTGIAPAYPRVDGETIKVADADVVITESTDSIVITELFFGAKTINTDYYLTGWLSYYGDYLSDPQGNFLPNQINSFSRNDQMYKDFVKILESIEFDKK